MDLIEATKKDKAYIKYKLIVKNWEKEFKTKHSRLPSKFDIKEAPSSIKYAYKKYFQLKSAALENSLSICDLEDEPFGSPDPVPHLEANSCEFLSPDSEAQSQPGSSLPSLPSGQELEQLLSQTPNVAIPSVKPLPLPATTAIQSVTKPLSPFTANFSKKLFQSKKFSLRNPRKSLSKSQSIIEDSRVSSKSYDNNEECSSQSEFDDLDIENINTSYTVNQEVNIASSNLNISCNVDNLTDMIKTSKVRQFNEAWLERATGVPSQEFQQSTEIETEFNSPARAPTTFGIANIKLINKQEKTNDFVENSESETEEVTLDKLKPALKKRKIERSSNIITSDRHLNEDDANVIKEKSESKKKALQTKSNPRDKSNKKSTAVKSVDKNITNDLQPPDISEYMPFAAEKDITPRHSKPMDILNKVESTIKENKPSSMAESEKLEIKIKNGTLNDNFVKINIEKKVFVRGKKHMNYSKYKKQLWKDSKALHAGMEFPQSGKISCFKCGGAGHMARYCTAHRGDTLLSLENYDDNDLPTLEEMKSIVLKEKDDVSITEELSKSVFQSSQIPESFMKLLADTPSSTDNVSVKPIYDKYQETPTEVFAALNKFGHTSFRPGQEEAIMRILCGMSTLLILSTGGGKSLCYQIPAYIYSQHFKCITLVISPLVSLMEDQVLNMPEFLKAGCLHNNQPPTQRKKIMQCIKDGEINILLISPEALISGDGSQSFTGLFRLLPQISFVCIDEAHCVSHWSHNFRPSYLMLCRVLREKLNVKCILGLTATASQTTIKSVISHFDIPDGLTGVITNPTLPDNLILAVSFEKDKDRALVTLLNSDRISAYNSIIVYCIRRDECVRVAAILRSCLQEVGKINMETHKQTNKRKRMSYIAEAYHAGMSAAQRKKIQKHFMDGTLRIIVATVAFGMGINKSDIRCIIHYNMPSSFESYVQEVGRAGRDGENAYCHILMNNSNADKNELLKHIHANTIDRPTIRKLLQKVFIPCECGQSQGTSKNITSHEERCKGHEVAIPIDMTVEELDLPSENIATLLCYVELHPKKYVKVLNNAYTMCKIFSYGGPSKILEAAKNCPPLAMAYLMESKKDPKVVSKNILEFNVIEVAAAIGWESGMTKYHLKNLEWIAENGSSKRSQLKIEFNTLGFRLKALGDLTPAELDSILDDIHGSVLTQEKAMLYQLEESHRAFSKLGNYSIENYGLSEDTLIQKSNELKDIIRNYFQRESTTADDVILEERPLDTERVVSDVRALITCYKDCSFNGRSIARIFQGITSPNYPAIVWGRCKYWRSHIHEDFYGIMKLATQQIIQMKM